MSTASGSPSAASGILDGIPRGTPLSTLTFELPTGRWAILVLPDDMTSAELQRLNVELSALVTETLSPLQKKAEQIEREDPRTTSRRPWEGGTRS